MVDYIGPNSRITHAEYGFKMKIDDRLCQKYRFHYKLNSAEKLMEQMQEVDPEHPVFLRTRMTTEDKIKSMTL